MTANIAALAASSSAAAIARVTVSAKRHGTFVSPTTGEILYVDPNHDDARHHSPLLTLAEAKEARMRGLIDDYDPEDANEPDEEDVEESRDPNDLSRVAAERTEEVADAAAEADAPGADTLASRQSTAWPDAERVQGSVEGPAAGPTDATGTPSSTEPAPGASDTGLDTHSADDDAPPAPAPKPARSSRAK